MPRLTWWSGGVGECRRYLERDEPGATKRCGLVVAESGFCNAAGPRVWCDGLLLILPIDLSRSRWYGCLAKVLGPAFVRCLWLGCGRGLAFSSVTVSLARSVGERCCRVVPAGPRDAGKTKYAPSAKPSCPSVFSFAYEARIYHCGDCWAATLALSIIWLNSRS